jgi:hypothetical protein
MFKYKVGDIVFSGDFYKVKIIKVVNEKEYHYYEVKSLINSLKIIYPYIDANLLEHNTEFDPISLRKQKLKKLNEKF